MTHRDSPEHCQVYNLLAETTGGFINSPPWGISMDWREKIDIFLLFYD